MSSIMVYNRGILIHQERFYDFNEAYREAKDWANAADQYRVKIYVDGFFYKEL